MDQADRDKTLDMAMSQIERQFGKGAIMKLSDSAVKNVAAIPTGALALDLALGIGGVPRGRVVEIYGPESSGKCLVADTQLWTDHGLETVAEFFERLGQPASCTSRVTDVSEFGARVVNERGELETVTALTHNNRRPVVEITLRSGRAVKVTMNHPLRVLNERGTIVWREAKEIAEGDTLVSATFGAVEATGGEHLSEDEAVLLGYLVAEGSLSSPNTVGFTNKDDEVGTEFSDLMGRLFDAEVKRYGDKEYRVHSKEIRTELADGFGLDYVTAAGKSVPNRVRVGGHKVQRAFLSALFEGDGWIDGSSTIGLASASQLLAQQVQLMLYGLGVPCSLSAKFNTEYQRDYWTVTVNPAVAHRFLDEVGFRSARRRGQVEKNFRHSPRDPQLENIPHLSGLIQDLRDSVGGDREFDRIAGDVFRADMDLEVSRSRLARIIGWARERDLPASGRAILGYLEELADHRYTFESVVSVRDAGEEPTFDIVVPGTHSFLANGMLSHNTTLALHVVAEAQRNGGVAAFIDAEHALDPEYAKALGVDVDELLISQPDTGEQALEIADMLIRSGALDVVVVDSVAALVPRAELEGDMGDTHVGLQARLMSQALRKLAGTINRSDTTAIFINQLREKIGVMFGCLNWDSPVTLADGSSMPIGKIVNQKLDVEVLSYDPDAEAVVPARLVNWYDNGKTEEFVRITVPRTVGRGASPSFAATSNHLVRTPGGWKAAGDLGVGDRVMRLATRRLSGFQMEVILGALMGDGALSPSQGSFGARFRMGHGAKQQEYLDWKASLFANIDSSSHTNEAGAGFFDLTPLPELVRIREAVYWPNGKTLSYDYLKRLTPLSLAIWYQDDGHLAIRSKDPTSLGARGRVEICVKALEESSRTRLVEHLRDTWGLDARLTEKGALETPTLIFGNDATEKFLALIAEHIHPSMEYKLLPTHRGQFGVEAMFEEPSFGLVALPITDTRVVRPTQRRHRYDLEVEGHHNYFAGGVMVHNSPETTPGGRALKFYASVRIDVRRIEAIKQGTDNVGNKVRAKIVKNKVAPPFRVAEFDIMFGEGISREGSLIDVAVEQGIVRKAGAWYTFDGDQLGQGREKAKQFLRENPELAMQLQDRVLRAVGVIEDEEDGAEETEAVEGADSGEAADEG